MCFPLLRAWPWLGRAGDAWQGGRHRCCCEVGVGRTYPQIHQILALLQLIHPALLEGKTKVLEMNCCGVAPCLGSAQGVHSTRGNAGGWQAGQRALSCRPVPYSHFPQDLPPWGLVRFDLKQKLLCKIPGPLAP